MKSNAESETLTLAQLENLKAQYERNRATDQLDTVHYWKLQELIKERKDKMDGDSVYA